jgi:hypothetical protein
MLRTSRSIREDNAVHRGLKGKSSGRPRFVHGTARPDRTSQAPTPRRASGLAGRLGPLVALLTDFLQHRHLRFYRVERRITAALVIRGRLGGLKRKAPEPIAIEAGLPRNPIQFFVGAGEWGARPRWANYASRSARY